MTTTPASIVDRVILVVRELVPRQIAGDRYVELEADAAAALRDLVVANVPAAFRQFQARDLLEDEPPLVTDGRIEDLRCKVELCVAYPQNLRAGDEGDDARAALIDEDREQLVAAVGWGGKANFTAPHPAACCVDVDAQVEQLAGVDVLAIRLTFQYWFDAGA